MPFGGVSFLASACTFVTACVIEEWDDKLCLTVVPWGEGAKEKKQLAAVQILYIYYFF